MKNRDLKAKFRQTKVWKEFRKKVSERQNGKDFVTGKKLYKGWNLHHVDMSVENYDKLIEDNFVAVNKQTHEVVHILFRNYKNDITLLNRLKDVLDKMVELNK